MKKDDAILGELINHQVIVWNIDDAKKLYKSGFFGKYVGIKKARALEIDKPLELSLIEAAYLVMEGKIKVFNFNRELSLEELKEIAEKIYENFEEMFLVYKDLRRKGYVVKSGMKFGTTFAVYKYGPGIDHAPFLVHVIPFNEKLDPIEIVRAGRLSHSVKKKFVIATKDPSSNEILYFIFKWYG
ncbi:MAG TPA: tRNA-intron lyase [Thermoprotei archaeon]|nr:tRNA-intron lyase [Thermoprotei archaeon]